MNLGSAKIKKLIKNQGIRLDLACGYNKQAGFIGLDIRDLPGVDIVHDLEQFPWPLPDESCQTIVAAHILEHINPTLTIKFMDECWRILKYDGQIAIAVPYGVSFNFIMDPTHRNPFNEATWQYFDPRFDMYNVYKPKPWMIGHGTPTWHATGNMEVCMKKIREVKC